MSTVTQHSHQQQAPQQQQRQHIETIVIEDSDSDADLPQVVGVSHRSSGLNAADKGLLLPGRGQRGQVPLPRFTSRSRRTNTLSERAKAKSRALDPPLSSSSPLSASSPVAHHPAPYRADPDATPITLPLLSTYNCPICLCPPTNAVTTPCGHVFCGSCLFDALSTQTKKKHQEDTERRIFFATRAELHAGLPFHMPPALTEAHLGQFSRPWSRPSYRATVAANAGAQSAASTSAAVRNSTQTSAGPASSSSNPTSSHAGEQPSFINGARAAAQNAFERLRPFAMTMFQPSLQDHQSESPADAVPPSSQGSSASNNTYPDSFASPPPSSAASSSSGGSSSSGFRSMQLMRAHAGMSLSNAQTHRGTHNLAGICPLCRGQIVKGFNVNSRVRPSAEKYLHKDGRPRRSVNNIDPSKGKVIGLRLTLGRPVDDPFSVALERGKKRTRAQFEDDCDAEIIIGRHVHRQPCFAT
ncbi:unnamed protein product [Tilletia controversa]|uniref:RING-type domain-containing protein n=2 Tax=Tilletia TaxID=13289 RepID=A0A177VAG7_9BASI|nr:hypothetical protein CF336_g5863 [Tilletia laevis]KAE8191542.1 hypothetical protein CF328_g5651 [Tilletia controversa]KAE8260340.1 hypothetical protein A4X03_0g3849 [Tilletia caries]KAE8194650.1 hypothetical protein CF335_g5294 [Tilletia laevis]CAD6888873.1 unnamed protein product [Tilletia caries]